MPLIDTDIALVALTKTDGGNETISSDAFGQALRNGQAFSSGTGVQEVGFFEIMNAVFTNPTADKNAVLSLRVLYGKSEEARPMEAGFLANSGKPNNPTRASNTNLLIGGPQSVMQFDWAVTEFVAGSTTADMPTRVILPADGAALKVETMRIVGPGQSTGVFMRGEFEKTDLASISFVWHEEDI